MQKENAVLRHLNAFGSNACRAAVITAMVTSMAPTTAIAATMTKTGTEATNNAPVSIQNEEANLLTTDSSSQNASSGTSYDLSKIADGTYTGKAVPIPTIRITRATNGMPSPTTSVSPSPSRAARLPRSMLQTTSPWATTTTRR